MYFSCIISIIILTGCSFDNTPTKKVDIESLYELLFLIFFVGKLQFIHTRLVLQNFTFYEDFKKKLKNPAKNNPFYKNIWQHIYRLLLSLRPKSLLNGQTPRNLIVKTKSQGTSVKNGTEYTKYINVIFIIIK